MNSGEYAKMFELEDHYWWFVGRRNLALTMLKKRIDAARQSTVLDLGCGTGVILRELQSWSSPVGVDMSALALSFCRKRGLERLVQGDGVKLPLLAASVDAIIGLDIFEHIDDDEAAFREAHRVLRPGGLLVMSVPAFKFLWGPHDIALMHFRRYRREEVRQRLIGAGFEIDRVSYSVFFLFPVIVVWRIFEKRKRGHAQASLVSVPTWLNTLLVGIQRFETWLIERIDLPFGSSVIAVGRKR